jgi:hypothetical protein
MSHGIGNSVWLSPFVEIFHVVTPAVLGGTILIVNLRRTATISGVT